MQATYTPVLCTVYYCFQLEDELNNHNDQEDTGKALTPPIILHGPSMFTVKAKIHGVLYDQASSIAFDETSSYWSALKSS